MPPREPTAAPGWYPYEEGRERYWDGESWLGDTRETAQPAPEASPRPGWYEDPHDSTTQRYWDGNAWTDSRAPRSGSSERETGLSNGWFILAVLIPLAGMVLAIIEWSRGNTGRGFGFAGAAVLSFVIYAAITCAGVSTDVSTGVSECVETLGTSVN